MLCLINFVNQCIYVIFCKRNFDECTFHWVYDKTMFKSLFGFTGWNFIGSKLHSLRTILSKDSLRYRCVNYKNIPNTLTAENLWAPPVKFATSQRMSRKGQSRFYASFDRETPLSEAVNNGETSFIVLASSD